MTVTNRVIREGLSNEKRRGCVEMWGKHLGQIVHQMQWAWVGNKLMFEEQKDGCLDGYMPKSRLGRRVLSLYIVLIPTVLSRGRKNLGKYL